MLPPQMDLSRQRQRHWAVARRGGVRAGRGRVERVRLALGGVTHGIAELVCPVSVFSADRVLKTPLAVCLENSYVSRPSVTFVRESPQLTAASQMT